MVHPSVRNRSASALDVGGGGGQSASEKAEGATANDGWDDGSLQGEEGKGLICYLTENSAKQNVKSLTSSNQLKMKKFILLIQLIVAGLSISQAAPAPTPTFGGFRKGQTFSFTVRERISSAVVGTTVIPDAAIPSQIPTFQVGQVVKFTIGSKGELKGPRFTIKFLADAGTSNTYANTPTRTNLNPNQAIVYKSGIGGGPSGAFLTFYYAKAGRDGFKLTTVTYALN